MQLTSAQLVGPIPAATTRTSPLLLSLNRFWFWLLSGMTPILLFSPYASQQSSPSETMAEIRRLHLEGQVSSSCALLLKRLRGKNDTSNKASKGWIRSPMIREGSLKDFYHAVLLENKWVRFIGCFLRVQSEYFGATCLPDDFPSNCIWDLKPARYLAKNL